MLIHEAEVALRRERVNTKSSKAVDGPSAGE